MLKRTASSASPLLAQARRTFSSSFSKTFTANASTTSLKRNRVPEVVDMSGKENRRKREAREAQLQQRRLQMLERGDLSALEATATKIEKTPANWKFVAKGVGYLLAFSGVVWLMFSPDKPSEDVSKIGTSNQAREAMAYLIHNHAQPFPTGRTQANTDSSVVASELAGTPSVPAPASGGLIQFAPAKASSRVATGPARSPFAGVSDAEPAPPAANVFFNNGASVYPSAAAAGARTTATAAAAAE